MPTSPCRACGADERYKDGHCAPCARKRASGYYRADTAKHINNARLNRQAHPEKYINLYLRRKYGITYEQYVKQLEIQGGGCAVCGSEPDGRRLHVDHSHVTGEVRAILCNGCNLALGHVDDSPDLLRQLAVYLENHL